MIEVLTHTFTRRNERKVLSFRMPYDGQIRGIKGLHIVDTGLIQSTVRYYGTGSAGANTAALVEAMTVVNTGHDLPFAVKMTSVNGDKIYYAHPKSLGKGTVLLNGESGQFKQPIELTGDEQVQSFYPEHGTDNDVDFYLYESINDGDGTEVTITVKRNN